MQENTEVSLIDKVRQSDHAAFSELYEKYWKKLYTYALQKIGNKEDIADIIQNIFVELWEKRNRIPDLHLEDKYYLRGILIHKIARYYRNKGFTDAHQQDFIDFFGHKGEDILHLSATTEKEESHQQVLALVHREIEELPEKMRNIFVLSCTRKYTVAEIASLLQVAPQTVKNQVSTALSRIRYATRELQLTNEELLRISVLIIGIAHL